MLPLKLVLRVSPEPWDPGRPAAPPPEPPVLHQLSGELGMSPDGVGQACCPLSVTCMLCACTVVGGALHCRPSRQC
jgi:hypothetical protein